MTGIDPFGKDFKDNTNPMVLFPPPKQEAEDPNAGAKEPREKEDDESKEEEDCNDPGDYDIQKTDDGKEMVVYDKAKGAITLSSGH